MNHDGGLREKIHALWDGLADSDAAEIDQALDGLLSGLCDLVDAQNAYWVGVVRLSDASREDPASGWRPPAVHFLYPTETLAAAVREQTRHLGQCVINAAAAHIFAHAGQFRACRLADAVAPEWFDSEVYRTYYRDCEREDAIYVAFPVNEDAESYFGIFRNGGRPRFTADERDTLAYALRGVKWFHRQLLLSHGLLVASAPLRPGERTVLRALLSGRTEKQVAADLGQSRHTTHDYVTSLYRKFGVNNRPALMALWLGKPGAENESAP